MAREIADGYYWIQECQDITDLQRRITETGAVPPWYDGDRGVHATNNAYLFRGEETLLFETLSSMATDQILREVDELLDGRGLDYLVLSHTDTPHCANTTELLSAHPETTLVVPGYGQPGDLYYLDDALTVTAGDQFDLGRYHLDVCEATFLDAAKSLWLYERSTGTLFTVDWLGCPHYNDECLQFAEESGHPPSVERLEQFHSRVFFWFEYVDPERTDAAMDDLLATYDPDVLAPAHGTPVRSDVSGHVEKLKRVVRRLNAAESVGKR